MEAGTILSAKEINQTCEEYCNFIDLQTVNQKGYKTIEETALGIFTRLEEYNEHLEQV